MDIKPLSQRDPRWGNKKLGFSNYSIASQGCTLTALTMLLNHVEKKNYTPDQVNQKLKDANAFIGALIYWKRVPVAFPSVKWISRAYNYSNVEVAWYVYRYNMPVMVEVNAAKIGAPRHWVLYVGWQKMIDPWTGNTKATSYYPATGYSLFQKA